jgi:hypothetical protein
MVCLRLCGYLLLTAVVCSLLSCASRKYIRKPTAYELESIDSLQLRLVHTRDPGEHAALAIYERAPGATGGSRTRLGATSNWSDEEYRSEIYAIEDTVASALRTQCEDDEALAARIVTSFNEESASRGSRIKITDAIIIPSSKEDAQVMSPPTSGSSSHVLRYSVYYKVRIVGTFIAKRTAYIGVRTQVYDGAESLVYERRFFSDDWTVNDDFVPEEFCARVLDFVNEVVRDVCSDLRG